MFLLFFPLPVRYGDSIVLRLGLGRSSSVSVPAPQDPISGPLELFTLRGNAWCNGRVGEEPTSTTLAQDAFGGWMPDSPVKIGKSGTA